MSKLTYLNIHTLNKDSVHIPKEGFDPAEIKPARSGSLVYSRASTQTAIIPSV